METLIISVLFVYGITTLMVDADGPFGFLYKLRQRISPLGCFLCTSFWFAAFASAVTARNAPEWVVHTFAIVGGAIFLNRLADL